MPIKTRFDQVFDSVTAIRDGTAKLAMDMAVMQSTLDELKDGHDSLHHKMFEGNGQPAIIPALHTRLTVIEGQLLPANDMRTLMGEVVDEKLETHAAKCQATLMERFKKDDTTATTTMLVVGVI